MPGRIAARRCRSDMLRAERGYCVPQAVQMKAGMTAGYTRGAVRATSCLSMWQNLGSPGSRSRVWRSMSLAATCTNSCSRMTYGLESGIAQPGLKRDQQANDDDAVSTRVRQLDAVSVDV